MNVPPSTNAQAQITTSTPVRIVESSGIAAVSSAAVATQMGGGASTSSVAGTPPSAGLKFPVVDEKKLRRTSLQVLLPKLPSSDSLSNSPGPASPGITNWTDSTSKLDASLTEKSGDASKLNRKESYKAQRKNYRREKKRVASELLNSLQDPAIVVLADWLKVRGTLKSWTKLWCVLKPGLLLLYKSPKTKSSHWVGTILLTSCQVIERPSKKDGFCFKLFHPLEQSIWAPRGPDKETIGAVVQPLPTAYLIFRAPSQAAGKCWMDALELSLRCSALLLRSNSNPGTTSEQISTGTISHETQWSEADYEKHFNEHASDKPHFLAKYVPPTPPLDNRKFQLTPDCTGFVKSSPCPTPTPLFQQLYLAVSHWERIMSKTPELMKVRDKSSSDLGSPDGSPSRRNIKRSRSLSVLPDATSDDEESTSSRRRSTPAKIAANVFPSDLDADSQNEAVIAMMSGLDSDSESDIADEPDMEEPPETSYVHLPEEEFGAAGEQVEELPEEHKSLIWFLVKQVRPGMDLSKVVLPTFILEPRSFLDKLSDSYYHADLLSKAVLEDDPFTRMKTVVQWYLSGFYKKPKGLKKPYNPILGETFRCYWEHENNSRTYYIAEQVSHHPPVSAFYVTNRQDGFCISCSILAKSKFYGNSTSAILDGTATLTLLPRGESYTLSVPYAHCKGILMGTLSMELGGKISIDCENTGYKAEIEFKLKPFLGSSEYTNLVTGRLKLGKETLAAVNGHWDGEIRIKDTRTGEESLFFAPTQEVKAKRLKRFVVPIESQAPNESERLWQHVSAAIRRDDQVGATEEKTALEEVQRNSAKERKATRSEWNPAHFQQDLVTGQWYYKYADLRPWDPRNDLRMYEYNYRIITKTRHQAPMVRTASIVSSEPIAIIQADSRQSLVALKSSKRVLKAKRLKQSASDLAARNNSDSSQTNDDEDAGNIGLSVPKYDKRVVVALEKINKTLEEQSQKLLKIQTAVERFSFAPQRRDAHDNFSFQIKCIAYVFIGLALSIFLKWIFK